MTPLTYSTRLEKEHDQWLMALTRGSDNLRELYAEAEALLRTGWLP